MTVEQELERVGWKRTGDMPGWRTLACEGCKDSFTRYEDIWYHPADDPLCKFVYHVTCLGVQNLEPAWFQRSSTSWALDISDHQSETNPLLFPLRIWFVEGVYYIGIGEVMNLGPLRTSRFQDQPIEVIQREAVRWAVCITADLLYQLTTQLEGVRQ